MNPKENQNIRKVFDLSIDLKLIKPLTCKVQIFKTKKAIIQKILQRLNINNIRIPEKKLYVKESRKLPNKIFKGEDGVLFAYGELNVDKMARYLLGLKQEVEELQ